MKTKLLILLLTANFSFSQTQINNNINGSSNTRNGFGTGIDVSSDGLSIAIGIPTFSGVSVNAGAVNVYVRANGFWTTPNPIILGNAQEDRFGQAVSISANGQIVAASAPLNDDNGNNAGHVRIFEKINNNWTQIGSAIEGGPNDGIGNSIALSDDGSIVAIGAAGASFNGSSSGYVSVFTNTNGIWSQLGNRIDGVATNDFFGRSVALSSSGNILAVGADTNDGNGNNSGHVRVFEYINGVWIQIGSDINGEAANDFSGISVSLSGDGTIVAIGANLADNVNGPNAGHVRIFKNLNNTWTQIGNDIDGEMSSDQLGFSVDLSSDGTVVAIGAPTNDGNGNNAGHARVYQNIANSWTQIGNDIDGQATDDFFGQSVALSGDKNTVVIASLNNDDAGNNAGQVRAFDLSQVVLSIDDFKSKSFKIYPNPVGSVLNIKTSQDIKAIEVISVLGKTIKTLKNITSVDLTELSAGVYFLKVQLQDGNSSTIRFLKE